MPWTDRSRVSVRYRRGLFEENLLLNSLAVIVKISERQVLSLTTWKQHPTYGSRSRVLSTYPLTRR
jgi:hypothetical protein